ncbi:uncharacterized protein LOC135123930 [Zophobas morio]|uniref:uncharacterized protein LOC135123930 n=1 Tax=Zophobas morio TaxID=2755281 RepID=UPI003082EF4D
MGCQLGKLDQPILYFRCQINKRIVGVMPSEMCGDRCLSGIPISSSASRLFFNERRPAAVIEPIGVGPGQSMGQKSDVKNYRGITLLNTAYKIYAMILDERLRNEMEARGMLPDGQAILGKEDVLWTMYFKAAFDSVNREKMWEYLRRKGVDAYLETKMEEIYVETVSKVRVNGIESESFYTTYLGDIEEVFRKAQTGGVVVGKEKVWSLVYADNLVIVAKKEKK